MSAQHTPGPWHTNGYASPISGAITVYHKPYGLGDVADVHDAADAILIAAAPDLLDALKAIADIKDEMVGSDWEEIELARSIARVAIAKATGGAA